MFTSKIKNICLRHKVTTTFSNLMKMQILDCKRKWLALFPLLLVANLTHLEAQESASNLAIPIAIVVELPAKPNSILTSNKRAEDLAIAGAQLGIDDSNTTGRFLKQNFSLTVFQDQNIDRLQQSIAQWEQQHNGAIIAVGSDKLLTTLLTPKNSQRLVINAGNSNDHWRNSHCQSGLLHTIPSQAMLSDALAQFLVLKRWKKWLLVSSSSQQDQTIATSYQRSAMRFGGKIIDTREWSFTTDLRRTAQQEVPAITQAKDYDVVIVTDANNKYGFYLPFNTWLPRPVAGSHGLTPVAWHQSIEQWGAVQLQNRFSEFTGRTMHSEDYSAWLAVRAIAEAVTRTKSGKVQDLYQYLLSDQFELAAFKGRKLTFRNYNGQLRQPIPLVQPNALVSQSPQAGFLHPVTDLDTLGYDKPEVKCNMDEV